MKNVTNVSRFTTRESYRGVSTPRTSRTLSLCFALVIGLSGSAMVPLELVSGSVKTAESTPDARSASTASDLFTILGTNKFSSVLSNWTAIFSPPAVTISSPTNNAIFIAGSTVVLSANASDPDGTVSKVEFFQGAVKLSEDTTAPYAFDWINVAAGDYVLTVRATDNAAEITTSAAVNISVLAQVKQYVGWSSISNGIDLGNGSVRKTSSGVWDFYSGSLQTLLAGDGYFESTAATYNQSINLGGTDGSGRAVVIGSGGWVGIYENNVLVAATSSNPPVPIISAHIAGDRYRIEITNSILRYVRYRSSAREVMFTSTSALPVYPISLGLGMSPQNAEWQKAVLAQLTQKATWSSITNGINLGTGSVKKTSTGVWDFSANAAQTLLRGDGYFESTASMYNQSISLGGSDGAGRALVVGSGGWAAIYENGQEVANTSPIGNITPHASGDRYRLEIANGALRYVKYRSGIRSVMYTSANPLPTYPLNFGLGASPQYAEWQNTVIAQLSQNVLWSYITNGSDLGNGSVRKTSTGAWDFGAGPKQQLVYGNGYFESTASYWNHSISVGGTNSASGALVVGTGGWAAIYENGPEVANTSPIGNITPHAAGDRYRLEISRGKLRYVRYRSGVRSLMFTSANAVPAYALGYGVGASFQNSEWQNTIFSDNVPEHNDASFVSQTVPTTMVPGQTYSVAVTMRNTGASTWTPNGDYQLASENLPDNQRWGLTRVDLTTIVLPGSNATFNFSVTAPATGAHSFQWRMVQQGVERFGALSTNVNVQTVNNPPTVSLTSPANNATFTAPATVALAANASDSDGTITKVEFFQGATKLGEDTTAPYTYSWTSVPTGTYVLTAKATDSGGATATSSAVNITVNPPNQPPSVSLTAPTNGQIFTAPANIPLTATATDTDGIVARVQFFQGTTLLGEDTTAPFSFTWSNVVAGSYSLTAKATDNASATVTSAAVAIVVNTLPTVSITSPSSPTTFTAPANFTITASAADADGSISKVEFFTGALLLGEDTTAPYSFAWSNVTHGSYVLTARATDNRGGVKTSTAVSAIVTNAPTSSITNPANNATFPAGSNIVINASASDTDGTVAKVEFFQNGVALGEDTTAPFSFAWNGVPSGSYALTTRATDDLGVTATSAPVNVNVAVATAITRLDPLNRTGSGGEDPLSRNFNWSVLLVGLPGRSGLDLGLSLSYNSLVWTKSGSFISFDDDQGFPGPGFRLGFPVIQPHYFNSEAGKWAYLLITPGGSRIELRQVGTSTLYEAADSSHLLFDSSTLMLRSTDGTQLTYRSDLQCSQIKDRNGNFITVNYTAFGRIDTVVDTLSRTIKFNYDGTNSLTSITQTWTVNGAPQTRSWASFTYNNTLPIQTSFSVGVTNVGPQNGSTLKVLTRVTFADSSRFDFDYTSWGQVWKVSNSATDGQHLLNYRSYNLRGSPLLPTGTEDDCPRFTERHDWAKNWNRNESGVEQEAITQFAVPVNTSWTLPSGTPQSGMRAQVTLTDGTYHKIYFHGTAGTSTGWHRGLASLVETFDSSTALQKKSVTSWVQDTEFSYPLNPRVVETNVYDGTGSNRRRVTTGYTNDPLPSGSNCRLPNDTREYASDATTVLRRTETDYRLHPTADAAYLNRHIIGLAKEQRLYGVNAGVETLMSRVGFLYDETAIQGTDAPVKHDNTNYSASFVVGRANLTSVKRYDVNTSLVATNSSKYNRAGAVVETTDPANHQVTISYTDAFAANGITLDPALPFVTLAYPSTVTDGDGYSSSLRYNYDFGAPTWKQTPMPNTLANTPGPQQKTTYDSLGRTERVTNLVNNAYTRFIYGPNYVETFATVNTVADEAHSLQVFDGAGRVIAKASNHSVITGSFSGQLVHYDVAGRAIKQSNPTETSISISSAPILPYGWQATGDDAQAGWVYTQQTYDWKGRPRITTNTDGTTKEASYNGCGCAGGEVVTLTDEGNLSAGVTKKRQQKVYADVLGRTVKTEVLNWDGGGPFGTGGSVYSATVNTYNARDQITQVRQYAGAEGSGTYQDTVNTFDGHGRLETGHVPQQDLGENTVWEYNPDDTIYRITDARNASRTFSYDNNRHLVNSITYAWPGGGTVPDPVSFGYDAAGNRTSMTDGLGSTGYNYDQLSRMTSESRTFTGVGTFELGYEYNLAGQLTKITDPFDAEVGYVHDTAGRVITVTGANFGSIPTYAENIQYRASGAMKYMDYGTNPHTLSMTYNTRLQPASFSVPGVMSKTYDYHADGRLKFSHDLLNAQFDRSYAHDHAGRITEALSGAEARNEGTTNSRPYKQSFVYDALGHLTERPVNKVWSGQGGSFAPSPQSYVNERNTSWEYDAEGNLTNSGVAYTIDAAGQTSRSVSVTNFPPDGQPVGIYGSMMDLTRSFDGDGLVVRKVGVETLLDSDPEGNVTTTKTFHQVRSSVLGGKVVSEIGTDSEQRGFVYIGGSVLAVQYRTTQTVNWEHRDAHNASIRMASSNGSVLSEESAELDPLGNNAAAANTATPLSPRLWKLNVYPGFGGAGMNGGVLCTMDNIATPCSQVLSAANSGFGGQCPDNDCSPRHNGRGWEFWNPGTGWRGWVDDDGPQIPNEPGEPEVEPGDTVRINTNDDGLGHWELNHFFFDPQNTSLAQIKDAVETCIRLLWNEDGKLNIRLDSFDPTTSKTPGRASLTITRGLNDVQSATITNSIEFSGNELHLLHALNTNGTYYLTGKVNGLTFPEGSFKINGNGDTRRFTPYINFTANDHGGGIFTSLNALIGNFVSTQIHELGNSMRFITGKNVGVSSNQWDPDSGHQLQGCASVKLTP